MKRSKKYRAALELVDSSKIYTVEEAVARMEAIDHPFFLYLDEEDDKISVVYKREDGGYGIPENNGLSQKTVCVLPYSRLPREKTLSTLPPKV